MEAGARPVPRAAAFHADRLADQVRLAFLWFCGNALWEALVSVVLPFLVVRAVGEAQKADALSLLATSGTLLASVVHPLAGWASDRTRTRFGRRRPYLVLGGIPAAAAIVWLGFAQGYGQILAAVLVLQFGYNVATAAYQAYIPEIAPAGGRGEASGFLGLMSTAGALVGAVGSALLVHGAAYRWMLAFLAALLLAGLAVTVWGLPEPEPRAAAAAPPAGGGGWSGAPPGRYRDFGWVLATRGLVMLSFYSMLTYLAFYIRDVDHVAAYVTATSAVVGVTILAAMAATLWAGRRSDAGGRRGIVSASGALMGLGALAFAALRGLDATFAIGLVFGLGYGAYLAVDWALVTDVLPDPRAIARDMGVWGLAITLPQVLAPAIGGALFALVPGPAAAYRWIFGLTALFALAGSALVWRVRGVR